MVPILQVLDRVLVDIGQRGQLPRDHPSWAAVLTHDHRNPANPAIIMSKFIREGYITNG